MSAVNLTEASNKPEETFDRHIGVVTIAIGLFGAIVSVLGSVGNYLCFRTAHFLPESTTKYLMKHLAVWDAVSVIQAGFVETLFQNSLPYLGTVKVNTSIMQFLKFKTVYVVLLLQCYFVMLSQNFSEKENKNKRK